MLPIHEKWAVLPSIVRANATNTLTIAPIERSFLFYEGTTYTVKITGSEADEPFYHTPVTPKILNVVAHGGVLTFSFDFEGEQEYLIQLKLENQKLALFSVYALNEDLYRLRPLRGDLHSHSFRSDGVCDAAALAEAIADPQVVVHAETSSTYGSCKWDAWKRACRQNGLHEMLTSAVTGSGFGVRAALVAGMSALGVSNKRVEWQDFGGADYVVDTVDKDAADIVLKMLKVS